MKATSFALLLALSLATEVAAATEADVRTSQPSSARRDIRLTVDSGITAGDHGGALVVGGEMLHRRGLLALGVVGEYGLAIVLPYRYWGGGVGAGISATTPSWMRIDLLGLAGAHRYEGVGGEGGPWTPLFQDPGVTATLPSLGARLSVAFELGTRARFVMGLKALVDRDLGAVTKTHTLVNTFPFAEPPTTRASTVGGTHFGALLTLGGAIAD